MSDDVRGALAAAADAEGLSAGAWVRRLIMDRLGVRSEPDARSGHSVRKVNEDAVAIATAIRDLATLSRALSLNDIPTAKACLDHARGRLIPLVIRRPAL